MRARAFAVVADSSPNGNDGAFVNGDGSMVDRVVDVW